MSLLTMLQGVTPRLGIAKPQLIVGATDDQTLQLLAVANEEGQDLAKRGQWQALTNSSTFTTLATESQGAIATLAGTGFDYIINETAWNRTQRRPLFGPLTSQQWEQLKASQIQGPWYQFTIRGGNMLFLPVPSAGQTCAFQWMSKNWVTTTGSTSSTWTADTDTGLLSEDLMGLGIIWRWLQRKGLEYAEDFNKYERQVADALARDGGKQRLSMGNSGPDVFPGVIVPSGSWMVS